MHISSIPAKVVIVVPLIVASAGSPYAAPFPGSPTKSPMDETHQYVEYYNVATFDESPIKEATPIQARSVRTRKRLGPRPAESRFEINWNLFSNEIVLGRGATVAEDSNAIAVGLNAQANGSGSIALGMNSIASSSGSVALGAGSTADRENIISVGSRGRARQVVNVAAGSADTDVVNVAQLKQLGANFDVHGEATNSFLAYDDASRTAITLGGPRVNGSVRLANVAEGREDLDAVNLKQLKDLGAGVDADGKLRGGFVAYNDGSKGTITLKGAVGTRLTNLAPGAIESDSSDAVTGAQLHETNETVMAVDAKVSDVRTAVEAIGKRGIDRYFNANSVQTAARANGPDALAMGGDARASGTNSIALGSRTSASAENAVAIGADSVADRVNSVSVGSKEVTRQITHVAAGTQDTDAVNVSQLREAGLVDKKGTALDAIVYDARSGRSSVTLGGVGASSVVALTNVSAGRIAEGSTDAVNGGQLFALSSQVDRLEHRSPGQVPASNNDMRPVWSGGTLDAGGHSVTNVAAGVSESDAVNLGQLNAALKGSIDDANAHTEMEIGKVRMEMEHDRKDASGGSASAIAIANLPQAYPGESMLSVAGGTFGGQSAVAMGLSTATNRWSVKVSFTGNTRGSYGGGAGAGYRF